MFALTSSERKYFYSPVPPGWEYKPNRCLGVPNPVMSSYLADHLCISDSRVPKHLGNIAKVGIEVTAPGALLRTVRHVVVNWLPPDYMTRVCDEGGVLINVVQGIIRK